LIIKHSGSYSKPTQQRYIIRVLFIIPVYAILSWWAYVLYRHSIFILLVREVYEAFALTSFFLLLANYIGDTPDEKRETLHRPHGAKISLPLPCLCIKVDPSSDGFLATLKYGILQYVVIRPMSTVVAIILQLHGLYCPDNWSPQRGHVYLTIVNFISLNIAMYSLFAFYSAMKDDLRPKKPLLKFICVKVIIFLTFWQGAVISVLAHFGVIHATEYWTTDNIATGLIAVFLTFELFILSIVVWFAFPYREYLIVPQRAPARIVSQFPQVTKYVRQHKWYDGIVDALNPVDLVRETIGFFPYLWSKITKKSKPKRLLEHEELANAAKAADEDDDQRQGRLAFRTATGVNLALLVRPEVGGMHRAELGLAPEGLEETDNQILDEEIFRAKHGTV